MNQILNEHKKLKKLSDGNFGIVYKVQNKKTKKIYALKEITNLNKRKQQIQREIDIMEQCNHKNLIKYYGYQETIENIFILMEYSDMNLFQFQKQSFNPLSHKKIKCISQQILEGLQYLHQKGIIHRDLKPQNILINKKGKVKICDFGSAISIDDKVNGQFENEGFTTWYKAPEILYGSKNYDYGIDIWSFGCIFAELILGKPLFPGINDFHQINIIQKLIGTPNEDNWDNFNSMPNQNKIIFEKKRKNKLQKTFAFMNSKQIEILESTIKYGRRLPCQEILKLSYLNKKINFKQKLKFPEIDQKFNDFHDIFLIKQFQ